MARPRLIPPPTPPALNVPNEFDRPARFGEATGPRDMAIALGPNNTGAGGGTAVCSEDPFLK